jgi:protein TonB
VEPPSPSSNPPPEYPRAARHRGQEGLVVVSVRVSPEGRVIDASVAGSSGYPLLDEAALDALRRWTFVPGVRGGRAAAWTVEIPVRFRLASATARP